MALGYCDRCFENIRNLDHQWPKYQLAFNLIIPLLWNDEFPTQQKKLLSYRGEYCWKRSSGQKKWERFFCTEETNFPDGDMGALRHVKIVVLSYCGNSIDHFVTSLFHIWGMGKVMQIYQSCKWSLSSGNKSHWYNPALKMVFRYYPEPWNFQKNSG